MKNKKLYAFTLVAAILGFIFKIKIAQLVAMPLITILLFELTFYMWKHKYIIHWEEEKEIRLSRDKAPIQFWIIYLIVICTLVLSIASILYQWSFFD